jgi:hypothetical protein
MLVALAVGVSILARADEDLTVNPAAVAAATSTAFEEAGGTPRPVAYTSSVQRAIERASMRSAAGGSFDRITTDTVVDALLEREGAVAARALRACGSDWRPETAELGEAPVAPSSNLFQQFNLEVGEAWSMLARSDSAAGPRTTGDFLFAALLSSPGTGARLGVTPEAYLGCLEAALAEGRES